MAIEAQKRNQVGQVRASGVLFVYSYHDGVLLTNFETSMNRTLGHSGCDRVEATCSYVVLHNHHELPLKYRLGRMLG